MALTGAEEVSRLVETYSPMLLRLACTRLENPADAEDTVQEVFLKLLTAHPAFRDAEHEKAWLIRTTLHRAADLRKAVARRNVPLEEALLAAAPEPEDPVLAAAFDSEDAVLLEETAQVGDYTVTLAGLVSGKDLSRAPAEYNGQLVSDRTYAVFSLARTDGEPLEELPDGLSYSPLVSGYHVSAINAWTLGATCQSFVQDGVAYYLFDTQNLEMFADHTVYFAIYEGGVPNPATFPTAEDGSISLAEGVQGALFTLPLDASKADPAAAEAFVESTGLEFIG